MSEKIKVILTGHCRFANQHHDMGEVIEFDQNIQDQADLLAMLNHSGRVAMATPENVKKIQAEAERMRAHEERGQLEAELDRRDREITLRERALNLDKREKAVEDAERKAAAAAAKES